MTVLAGGTRETRETTHADDGFTLIEVIVAFALFMVLLGSSTVVLAATQDSTRDNSRRTAAINLAARELAITADTFNSLLRGPEEVAVNQVLNPDQLPGGTPGEPLVIDNVPYTVKRTAQWAAVGSAASSTCDDGTSSELAYLRVRVEVTWPGGEDHPVRMTTLMTPLKGTYSSTDGHIGLKVIDRDGVPRAGQSVTISGPSGTRTASTAEDGCVLFAYVSPGTYTVTLNTSGYVDIAGAVSSSRTVTVTAGQLWRGSVSYDRAARMAVHFTTAPGYALPRANDLPLMFTTSAGSVERTGSGNNRTVSDLWPYASGYEIWAGHCLDNDPANLGEARAPVAVSDPGTTTSIEVALAPLTVSWGGAGAITAVSNPSIDNPQSPCAATTVDLGTPSGGVLATSLPYGRWTIKAGSASKDVTLTQAAGPQTVSLP
ncbi:prepilin-type N-terminal cleavage/methylation domain-containing protein [Nocardioides sp. GY 10113]|uniref:prepilin-type N-terminal cleavage/methylation domain-containing protein n=1 Tax=Nocardioides sp. GY 10113 TaxID=2569761 RepID=UPI001458582D|nr:prepilin-type N-terminal cleavage/methylation domain-containing protein [Nocardioides sp. GY 10113]